MTRCTDCKQLFPLHEAPYRCNSCTGRLQHQSSRAVAGAVWHCRSHEFPVELPTRAAALEHARLCRSFATTAEGSIILGLPDGVFREVNKGPWAPDNFPTIGCLGRGFRSKTRRR